MHPRFGRFAVAGRSALLEQLLELLNAFGDRHLAVVPPWAIVQNGKELKGVESAALRETLEGLIVVELSPFLMRLNDRPRNRARAFATLERPVMKAVPLPQYRESTRNFLDHTHHLPSSHVA